MVSPKVVAIGNKKGGVAKTTTCLSLGSCLASLGKRVLLIDLDPEAHLTLSVSLNPRRLRRAVGDAFLSGVPLSHVIYGTSMPSLDLVPANQALEVVGRWLHARPGYEYLLKRSLAAFQDAEYDWVLVDCPPSGGVLTLNAFTAADLLIIPTPCEYYASRSLQNALEMVRQVRQQTNPGLAYRVLITLYDRRNRISFLIRQQLEGAFAGAMFKTVIEVDTRLRESPTCGLPIVLYAPATRGARQYLALARELLTHGQKNPSAAA
ncbi:MAG: ParA family protein [Chloroflexota bacterium]